MLLAIETSIVGRFSNRLGFLPTVIEALTGRFESSLSVIGEDDLGLSQRISELHLA